MANRHLLTTIVCIVLLVAIFLLTWTVPVFMFVAVSLYALSSAYFIEKVLHKYMPQKEDGPSDETVSEE